MNSGGKHVIIGNEAREKMQKGVDILANAVKSTLGPRGRHVAIERKIGPPLVTKDGVTVARHIILTDRIQNMGAQLIKSVASDANSMAGDGTTTATVLSQEIYGKGMKVISAGQNPVLIKKGIDYATDFVLKSLKDISIPVEDEETLRHVAVISANNDQFLGKLIAESITSVGNDGIINVEEAAGYQTEVKYIEGLKIPRGWINENFVNNSAKATCEYDNPFVLLFDGKIINIRDIVNILNEVISANRPLFFIVKDIDQEALAHIVLNKTKGVISCCVIKAPAFGDHRKAFLDDIALLTGARVFSESDGDSLEKATLADLGTAQKISAGPNITTLISYPNTEKIQNEVSILREKLSSDELFEHNKEVVRARLSRLTGGVALFRVGGTTESEVKEKKDRVEDAINAVRSAIVDGVVPGGGSALIHIVPMLEKKIKDERDFLMAEEVSGMEIVMSAIKAPFSQILRNAGMEEYKIYELIGKIISGDKFCGFDALKMEYVEDMIEKGIIDPLRVVKSSLSHAASASGTLLTTEVSIFLDDAEDELLLS